MTHTLVVKKDGQVYHIVLEGEDRALCGKTVTASDRTTARPWLYYLSCCEVCEKKFAGIGSDIK